MLNKMEPRELRGIVKEVYGTRGQRRMSKDIGRGEVTMSRWLSGTTPIGEMECLVARMILMLHRKKLDWRKWLATYLREERGLPEKPDDLEDLL